MAATKHRVLVVGGGFGGLQAARSLKRAPVDVTLVDRRNFHLFQPLLYQVATGGLSPANIAAALRSVVKGQRNVRVLLGEVDGFDLDARRVRLADGTLDYDTLVVAAGMENTYHGHDEWAEAAPPLKTLEDALEIRRRILVAFEEAERAGDAAALTFVVIGAGPTGVELAGTIGEMSRYTLRREFRRIDPAKTRILLVDLADRVLPSYPEELSRAAQRSLERLGVTVRCGTGVDSIRPGVVTLAGGETVRAPAVFWAAGVKASPLGAALGAELDRMGRVRVGADLTLPGRPEVFVVGDLARLDDAAGEPLPGIAPVAMQQGRYVAKLVRDRLRGRTRKPFRYRHWGSMATIGRAAAVADLGRARFTGYPAWLAWLFVHLVHLVQFENKALVLFQWAWNYLTFGRAARIITRRGKD